MGKIRHSPISLLAFSKKNVIYEQADLIGSLEMSVKVFAELCGVGICMHAFVIFLCYYNAEHCLHKCYGNMFHCTVQPRVSTKVHKLEFAFQPF